MGRRLSIDSSGSDRRLQLELSAFLSILSKVLTYIRSESATQIRKKNTLRLIQLQLISVYVGLSFGNKMQADFSDHAYVYIC